MVSIFWKFKLFDAALIWLQIRNLRPQISWTGLFQTSSIHFWRLFIACQNFCEILQVCSFNGCQILIFFLYQKLFWHEYGIHFLEI